MYWLKACPQCRGDLYENNDHYGWYIACFQCGYQVSNTEEEAAFGSSSNRHHPRLPKFKSPEGADSPEKTGLLRRRKWRDSVAKRR